MKASFEDDRIKFKDDYDTPCSLFQIISDEHRGERVVLMDEDTDRCFTLTQDIIKELLPYLTNFAETGKLI